MDTPQLVGNGSELAQAATLAAAQAESEVNGALLLLQEDPAGNANVPAVDDDDDDVVSVTAQGRGSAYKSRAFLQRENAELKRALALARGQGASLPPPPTTQPTHQHQARHTATASTAATPTTTTTTTTTTTLRWLCNRPPWVVRPLRQEATRMFSQISLLENVSGRLRWPCTNLFRSLHI